MTKTILVTGGAGYIGSHACKALVQAGYMPVAYDNLVYGHDWAVKWGPFEIGDVTDKQRLMFWLLIPWEMGFRQTLIILETDRAFL